jgi:adenine-specific DNA-methyltransferase
VKTRKSDFNSRSKAKEALRSIICNARARIILLSFNNEGFHTESELLELASEKGYVAVLRHPYKRYIGAQIGIYNSKGEKVGKISHLKNEELFFVISKDKKIIENLAQKASSPVNRFKLL